MARQRKRDSLLRRTPRDVDARYFPKLYRGGNTPSKRQWHWTAIAAVWLMVLAVCYAVFRWFGK